MVQFNSSARGSPVVPLPFVKEAILSLLHDVGTVVESQLAIDVWVCLWALNSIPLACVFPYGIPHKLTVFTCSMC